MKVRMRSNLERLTESGMVEAVSIALLAILIFLSSSGFTAPNKITFTLRFILTFTIDFETAKRYREANKMPHQFRRAAWTDLTVEVYL